MKFQETPLPGAYTIEVERMVDERGWFARTFAIEAFESLGLASHIVQCSASFNAKAGTLRGMHFQQDPDAETKLVRCTRGAVYDVAVDLRRDSPAYMRWFAAELSAENGRMLYMPHGFAHGFLTLEDATELEYAISHEYVPSSARGLRWDDPAIAIEWPEAVRTISERDRGFPDFEP